MDPERLTSAAQALENAFFAKENARLLEQLREKARQQERRAAMREAIQIDDEGLIDHLMALGLGPETVLAMTLVPLALVAWSDGAIQPAERDAILRAAADEGVQPGSVAGQLLESWLSRPLDGTVVEAWKRYTQAIWPSLTPHEREEIRTSSLGRAAAVAEAAGGFLGLTSKVSARERAALDELGMLLAG
jgi:hypothetical protein